MFFVGYKINDYDAKKKCSDNFEKQETLKILLPELEHPPGLEKLCVSLIIGSLSDLVY